jgi:hypothetical protein
MIYLFDSEGKQPGLKNIHSEAPFFQTQEKRSNADKSGLCGVSFLWSPSFGPPQLSLGPLSGRHMWPQGTRKPAIFREKGATRINQGRRARSHAQDHALITT